jgi:glycosyltransferase involved in cell wall biosynthesis
VGGYKVAYRYANHLAAKGHAVTVVNMRTRDLAESAPLKRLALRALYFVGRSRRPQWVHLDRRIRVVNLPEPRTNSLPPSELFIATAVSTADVVADRVSGMTRGLYLIQHFEEFAAPVNEVIRTWRLPLRRVVVSKWLAELASDEGLQSTVIENGVNTDQFKPGPPQEVRQPSVLSMVSDQAFKRTDLVISAYTELDAVLPNVQLRTFGAVRRPPGLPASVVHHRSPNPSLLAKLYQTSQVFICSSDLEGFGLPVLEAMACETAVVSTTNGGVESFARGAALLVPPGDAGAIASAVTRLISDAAERSAIARRGAQRAANLSELRAAERFAEVVAEELAQLTDA